MEQKCYFCGGEAKIFRDPNGIDRNCVKCPVCTEYYISRNAIAKISEISKPLLSNLCIVAKKHFQETGKQFEFDSIQVDFYK